MVAFFPRRSIAWKVEEPAAFRRLTLSAAEIGVLTGVVLRLARAVFMARAGAGVGSGAVVWTGWWYVTSAVVLCGAAAAHLGNYPVRHWGWRAPLFALYESGAEALTSLALIAAHRETHGSSLAAFSDWPNIAIYTLLVNTLFICAFSLILAGVVQLVRFLLDRHDR